LKVIGIAAIATLALAAPHAALAQDDFYRGKTVEVLVGFSAGGGYDAYGRALSRFLGNHIPGNPTVVVRNMPGAGSLSMVNHINSVAAKNGLTIGIFDPSLIIAPLLGGSNAKYDASKLSWIGSMAGGTNVCITWHASPAKTWDDLFSAQSPWPFGTTGPADSRYQHTAILRNMFGAKVKPISGYTGSSEVRLAMERGEIAGNCGDSWSSLKSTASDWLKERKINIIAQFAIAKHKELPDVPLIVDQAKSDLDRAALRLLLGPQVSGRPFIAPPGVPAEQVATLRRGFDATMKDPAFIESANKMNLEIDPVSGAEVEKLITEIYRTPPAAVAAAREAIK
jgi:tripartite-type tricarboxylate transporter receptor subunit TctC